MNLWISVILAAAVAFAFCYLLTPKVKKFAEFVGAIDIPNDRRINDHPVPRMGGLAIFVGFMVSMILFVQLSPQIAGMLLGACIIVAMGALDDIVCLKPWVKLAGQCVAAFVAIRCGIVFNAVSTLSFMSSKAFVETGWYSIPLTFLWIVGCTNAVNLIDGLDGLAVGVSAISSATLLIVSALVSENTAVTVVMAGLVGACLGFIPYNHNPAKIFMGDVGSQFLGFVLSTASIIGMFKMHALVTFFVPVIAMAVPLADTTFAFVRRIAKGQSPFKADKGHFHHRLLAMGLDQKQAVMVLYAISAFMGLLAVALAGTSSAVRILCMLLMAVIVAVLWAYVYIRRIQKNGGHHAEPVTLHMPGIIREKKAEPQAETAFHAASEPETRPEEPDIDTDLDLDLDHILEDIRSEEES